MQSRSKSIFVVTIGGLPLLVDSRISVNVELWFEEKVAA